MCFKKKKKFFFALQLVGLWFFDQGLNLGCDSKSTGS